MIGDDRDNIFTILKKSLKPMNTWLALDFYKLYMYIEHQYFINYIWILPYHIHMKNKKGERGYLCEYPFKKNVYKLHKWFKTSLYNCTSQLYSYMVHSRVFPDISQSIFLHGE